MNQNKTPTILLTVISVVFVLILVVLAINLSKNQPPLVNKNLSQVPSIIPTTIPTPTTSVPSDWKTYINKSYGIEFKYPKDMELMSSETDSANFELDSSLPEQNGYGPLFNTLIVDLSVISGGSLDQIIESDINYFIDSEGVAFKSNQKYVVTPIFINNNVSKRLKLNASIEGNIQNPQYVYITLNNNKFLKIEFSSTGEEKYNLIVDQILSTLKINDPTSTFSIPSDWKTYVDSDNGYSFKYPANFIPVIEENMITLISDTKIAQEYKSSLTERPLNLSFKPVGFIRISVLNNPKSVEEYISEMNQNIIISNLPIIIDSKLGNELTYYWHIGQDNSNIEETKDLTYEYIIKVGNNIITFQEYWGQGYKNYSSMETIYRQILSTIKFTQ